MSQSQPLTYPSTNHRPPKAPKELVSRLYQISPIASCLDRALSALVAEDQQDDTNVSIEEQEDDSCLVEEQGSLASSSNGFESEVEASSSTSLHVKIDEDMKAKILEAYGDAMHHVEWEKPSSSAASNNSSTRDNDESDSTSSNRCYPPAALLKGKLKYYNRMGGQWRIVVSDAEIRQRVNLPPNVKQKDQLNLWDHSVEAKAESIPIDGELVILAYDDT